MSHTITTAAPQPPTQSEETHNYVNQLAMWVFDLTARLRIDERLKGLRGVSAYGVFDCTWGGCACTPTHGVDVCAHRGERK